MFCRFRPTKNTADYANYQIMSDKKTIVVCNHNDKNANNKQKYTFSHIFNHESTQQQIYDGIGKQVVEGIYSRGRSSLVFTYGVTNAGKTYTLIGNNSSPKQQGLLIRITNNLLSQKDYFLQNKNEENTERSFFINNWSGDNTGGESLSI